jgi:hypothetical protein
MPHVRVHAGHSVMVPTLPYCKEAHQQTNTSSQKCGVLHSSSGIPHTTCRVCTCEYSIALLPQDAFLDYVTFICRVWH